MHQVRERLERYCSDLPGLKIVDSGAPLRSSGKTVLEHLSTKIAIIGKRWFVGRLIPTRRKKNVAWARDDDGEQTSHTGIAARPSK